MNPFGRTVSLGTECCLADVEIVSPMVARVDVLELINYLFFYFRASLRLVILVIPVIPVIRTPEPQKRSPFGVSRCSFWHCHRSNTENP